MVDIGGSAEWHAQRCEHVILKKSFVASFCYSDEITVWYVSHVRREQQSFAYFPSLPPTIDLVLGRRRSLITEHNDKELES